MSASLGALAVARRMRTPTKSDAGVVTEDADSAGQPATTADVLSATVPTGLIAAYTVFIAALAASDAGGADDPVRRTVMIIRWIGFGGLLAGAALLTLLDYRRKQHEYMGLPLTEMAGVTAVSAAWGLGMPGSPLLSMVTEPAIGVALISLITLLGAVASTVTATMLTTPTGVQSAPESARESERDTAAGEPSRALSGVASRG